MSDYHIPVMLKEVLEGLNIQKDAWYIDCNLGGGGHTSAILERGGRVLGIDLDPQAIAEVAKNHQSEIKEGRLKLFQSNFSKIDEASPLIPLVKGILFDLGVSSFQLETANRGFSFNKDAPLDMRMNPEFGATAADLINGLHEGELAELFLKLGEENFAKPIAKRIIEQRSQGKIETTNQLAQIIVSVRRKTLGDRTHPATRVFQALRIAVNDELNSLKEALPKAFELLSPGGRLVVISFHSLEDRIVKNFMKELEKQYKLKIITKKPLTPTEEESSENPRARSGKLRIAEKI